MQDVADALGVSASAVSLALSGLPGVSDETRERVVAEAERLGFRANRHARALRAGAAPTVGIIIPDITNPYYADIVVGVEESARALGWEVLLYNVQLDPERERSYLKRVIADDLEGVVYVPLSDVAFVDADLRRRIDGGPPLVILDEVPAGEAGRLGVGAVSVANEDGGRMVARHFAENGRHRAAVFGPPRQGSGRSRVQGFLDECERIGMDAVVHSSDEWTPLTRDGVLRAVEMLTDDPSVDCFFAGNDVVAIQVMAALERLGVRVPEQLAVCGFDGIVWSATSSPALTTVAQPTVEVGRRAVGILAAAREDPSLAWTAVELPVHLLVRASTSVADTRS